MSLYRVVSSICNFNLTLYFANVSVSFQRNNYVLTFFVLNSGILNCYITCLSDRYSIVNLVIDVKDRYATNSSNSNPSKLSRNLHAAPTSLPITITDLIIIIKKNTTII